MNIGLIGLGAMGGAYAKHLITNNFNCYGIDLDKKNISKFLNLGGSEITYPYLFKKVDVVLLSLPSLEAYKNVLDNLKKLGKHTSNKIILDMNTISIEDKINFKNEIINFNDTFNILLEVTFIDKIVGKIFNLDKKKIDPLSKNGLAKFMINNSENFIIMKYEEGTFFDNENITEYNKFKIMTPKSEQLVDLIFKKLKTYKNKKIFLEKESLNKFILSLFKENWMQDLFNLTAIFK